VGDPPPARQTEAEEQPGGSSADAAAPGGTTATALVKGRVTIADEVVEKIAMLAAQEVGGVAALSGAPGTPGPAQPDGAARPGAGVRVHVQDNAVTVDVAVAVEYGTVIMDVANVIKANVARAIGLMTGMRVLAVNITVDDVRLPDQTAS
jgi:uncharacterized alkaline shock family protein YloU